MKDLIHIVYVSFSEKELAEIELQELLTDIRARNHKHKITGLLLYNDGSFIQIIEGPKQIIHNLFDKIKIDRRHSNVVLLLDNSIIKRAFPDWSMGYYKVTKEQSKKIPGYSDFMHADNPSEFLKGACKDVMNLLNSFKNYT
jgi:hypothetical protein